MLDQISKELGVPGLVNRTIQNLVVAQALAEVSVCPYWINMNCRSRLCCGLITKQGWQFKEHIRSKLSKRFPEKTILVLEEYAIQSNPTEIG